MPKLGNKHFSYTKKGIEAFNKAKKEYGKDEKRKKSRSK